VKKRFLRRKVIVSGPTEMFDADLLDLNVIKGQNHKKRYLFTMIDVFSKKVYACAISTKSANAVAECLEKILNENSNLVIKSIRTDHGKCFFVNLYVTI